MRPRSLPLLGLLISPLSFSLSFSLSLARSLSSFALIPLPLSFFLSFFLSLFLPSTTGKGDSCFHILGVPPSALNGVVSPSPLDAPSAKHLTHVQGKLKGMGLSKTNFVVMPPKEQDKLLSERLLVTAFLSLDEVVSVELLADTAAAKLHILDTAAASIEFHFRQKYEAMFPSMVLTVEGEPLDGGVLPPPLLRGKRADFICPTMACELLHPLNVWDCSVAPTTDGPETRVHSVIHLRGRLCLCAFVSSADSIQDGTVRHNTSMYVV